MPAKAAAVPSSGTADGSFSAGDRVTHGYYDHVKGENVTRSGVVLASKTVSEVDATGTTHARPGYDVGWFTDVSTALPATELRPAD